MTINNRYEAGNNTFATMQTKITVFECDDGRHNCATTGWVFINTVSVQKVAAQKPRLGSATRTWIMTTLMWCVYQSNHHVLQCQAVCIILTCSDYPCSQGCHTEDQSHAAFHVATNLEMILLTIFLSVLLSTRLSLSNSDFIQLRVYNCIFTTVSEMLDILFSDEKYYANNRKKTIVQKSSHCAI